MRKMISYMSDAGMVNKYAYLTEGTDREREELKSKGYKFFSEYEIRNKAGKIVKEEIWIR